MRSPFRRRLGAATAATLMAATGTVGGLALAVVGAGSASAAYPGPTKVSYNNNACQTGLAPAGTYFDAPLSLGSDQSYPGIAIGVDAAGLPLPGGITVAAAGPTGAGLAPTAGILQGSNGTLTNVGGDAFLAESLVGAGVGGGFITVGQSVPATATFTVNAYGGATLPRRRPSGRRGRGDVHAGEGHGCLVPARRSGHRSPRPAARVPQRHLHGAERPGCEHLLRPGRPRHPGHASGPFQLLGAVRREPGVPAARDVVVPPWRGNAVAVGPPTAQSAMRVFAAVDVQPALAPTLVPQTVASMNLGGQVNINTLAGATSNVPITSVQLVTPAVARLGDDRQRPRLADLRPGDLHEQRHGRWRR